MEAHFIRAGRKPAGAARRRQAGVMQEHCMRIGIISDTHGRAERLRQAVDTLCRRGVDALVHCGDVGSAECVAALAGCDAPAYVVLGNMDRRPDDLVEAASEHGVTLAWEVVEVPIGAGEFLVATHGHDENLLGELIAHRQFPYVCHGHTHRMRDERYGPVRVINPGALHNAHHHTVALLDTLSEDLDHIRIT
jgi:hypothetical protein